jgi:hypothetical protein
LSCLAIEPAIERGLNAPKSPDSGRIAEWQTRTIPNFHEGDDRMPRYLNISNDLRIVISGEGCGFLPGPPTNDVESVEIRVSEWLEKHESHEHAAEVRRWLEVADARIERARKERHVIAEVAAFKNRRVERLKTEKGDLWAKWHVEHYHVGQQEIENYEKDLRQKRGLA